MLRKYPIYIPALIALAFMLLPVLKAGQFDVKETACGEYCEGSDQCHIVDTIDPPIQPWNTWSNLAYLVVGILALRLRSQREKKGIVTSQNQLRLDRTFAATTAILAVGSSWFHGFLTQAGQLADEIGMYAVFSFLAIYAMFVMFDLGRFWLVSTLSIVAGTVMAIFVTELSSTSVLTVLGVSIVGSFIVAIINKKTTWKAVGMALAPFAVAFLFRQLDVMRVLCEPESWFQGHVVWHIFSAIGILMVYRLLEDIKNS